jgi:hypothetical protein
VIPGVATDAMTGGCHLADSIRVALASQPIMKKVALTWNWLSTASTWGV